MTHLLCLETATEICSVALSEDDRCIACVEDPQGNSHAELLMPLIDQCLRQAGVGKRELDAVCISSGPGSYTGLRIGTSSAKGLCYALSIPLLAVPSLEGIACGAAMACPDADCFRPMIDARRMEVYTALYDAQGTLLRETESLIINSESFATERQGHTLVLCGNGAPKCRETLQGEGLRYSDTLSSARYLIPGAFRRWKAGQREDTAYFEPYYLKAFQAGKPHVKGLR
ncbi:MAG: tRNA (adenosine(37)-N6)-threonylcarbamoyltransferase complex dimerization subunit type 1 TsaB [Bacteroidales bacterium]|nr:tRNA (adenosine(37)-N6)-threonylcarbamoyltransferase complex dimerization subunit type 1 TsaB [Bacteroidales bacterium]